MDPNAPPPARAATRSLAVVLLVVFAGAALTWLWLRPRSAEKQAAAAERPAPVVTANATPGPLLVEERYYAELRAVTDAELTAGEAGRVRSVSVREGDRVKRGDVLLVLDAGLVRAEARRASAAKTQAVAELEQAKREAERFKRLGKETVVSETEVESKASQAEVVDAVRQGSEAQVSVMRERLARHKIVAPFDGVIARRNVHPGDWLDPGRTALSLVTDGRVEVFVRVPPSLLDRVGKLENAEARVIKNGKVVAAVVAGQVNALDPTTRTALARLRPSEDAPWLRAGDTAEVAFRVPVAGGVVVPRDALVYGVAEVRVIKWVDGKATPITVQVLGVSESGAMVRGEGLSNQDPVVTRGNERLRPGQALTTDTTFAAPSGSSPAASTKGKGTLGP
ncbi:MAG TPA: efflux RND transporter periplasmic adaptor subunit [Polyangiaceae bacterium]|nr:efflux RND transporter periplasmic adaptor subunit [Polyangiaceae bacterium]